MSIPRHERYKQSGVAWLGNVPEHWPVMRSRRLFSQRNERARADDEQLTASQKHGIVSQEAFMDLEGRAVVRVIHGADILKHVEPNDFVISMRSFQGGLEWSALRGSISSAYVMLVPDKRVVPEFFRYVFKCAPYIQALQSTSNLVRDGQAMRYENFTQIDIPLPETDEQTAIARFLDQETAKIDALIEEQQRLIDLLSRRIEHSVLTAQNSKRLLFSRLRHAVEVVNRPVQLDSTELYTALGLYNRGRGIFHKEPKEGSEMGDSDFFWVEPGDLIISGQFAWEGAVALGGGDESRCVVSHRYPVIRGLEGVLLTEYLFALFLTSFGRFLLNENSRGAAGRNRPLNLDLLLKERVKIPGTDVQRDVARMIYQRAAIVKKIAQQTKLLQERRSALISAAVTGKINVTAQVAKPVRSTWSAGFARQVLAAETLSRCNGPSMGRVKLQKLIHLCEYHAQLDEVRGTYSRQAAGPFAPQVMEDVRGGLLQQRWFEEYRDESRYGYRALEKAGGHKQYLPHWEDKQTRIDQVLNLLGGELTQKCEIASTLYAAWNDLLIDGKNPTDAEIVHEASSAERWHESKEKIAAEKWRESLKWMRAKGLVPVGYGTHTTHQPDLFTREGHEPA